MVLLVVAVWVSLGTLTPGLSAVALAVILDRYFVAPEEDKLLSRFGALYAEYSGRVRRWL